MLSLGMVMHATRKEVNKMNKSLEAIWYPGEYDQKGRKINRLQLWCGRNAINEFDPYPTKDMDISPLYLQSKSPEMTLSRAIGRLAKKIFS